MALRLSATIGAAALLLVAAPVMAATTSKAPAAKKPMHHMIHHVSHKSMAAPASATDRLNAESLSAARAGTTPAVANAPGK